MSIIRENRSKLYVFFVAVVLATTVQAMPMLFSDITDLVDAPAVMAGDPGFGDDGCC